VQSLGRACNASFLGQNQKGFQILKIYENLHLSFENTTASLMQENCQTVAVSGANV